MTAKEAIKGREVGREWQKLNRSDKLVGWVWVIIVGTERTEDPLLNVEWCVPGTTKLQLILNVHKLWVSVLLFFSASTI